MPRASLTYLTFPANKDTPLFVPLWAKDAHPPIAGKFSTFLCCNHEPLFRIVPHQTQQNPILQTNDSYMPEQDTSL
jgi:hypothetical protein